MQGETAKILLQSCREMGITTAIETSGYGNSSVLCDLVPHTDLFLYDVKDTDDARHKAYTGVSNQLILENLSRINALGAKIRLRCLLINGVNTHNEHYQAIAKLALGISLLDGVEFLSYHAYGGSKSELLGGVDNGRVEWIPTDEQLAQAKAVLLQHGISQTQIF